MRLFAVLLVFVAAVLIWTAKWFLSGEPEAGPSTPLAAAAMADGTAPRDHHAEPSDLPTRVEQQDLDDLQGGARAEPAETIQVRAQSWLSTPGVRSTPAPMAPSPRPSTAL